MLRKSYFFCYESFLYFFTLLLTSCSIENYVNRVNENFKNYPYYEEATKEANELHKKLFIIDAHADSLIWGRDLTKRSKRGQVDFPRLIEGNVAVQILAVPTKFRPGIFDPFALKSFFFGEGFCAWFNPLHRALYQASRLEKFAQDDPHFYFIKNRKNLEDYIECRKQNRHITSGILAIEGAHVLQGDIKNVKVLFEKGFRIMSPTHLFDNRLGGSERGKKRGGLTTFGEKVLIEMEKHKMLLDLSHASPHMIDDVTDLYRQKKLTRPLIASHTGVLGVSPHERNLSDKHLKEIARSGGVICIGYFPPAIPYPHPQEIVKTIYYVIDVLNKSGFRGIDHVGLGSDFDGGVKVPFDTTGLILITEELLSKKYGFSEEQIFQIMGGNLLRVLRKTLPKY